jgi:hypothetical protein
MNIEKIFQILRNIIYKLMTLCITGVPGNLAPPSEIWPPRKHSSLYRLSSEIVKLLLKQRS